MAVKAIVRITVSAGVASSSRRAGAQAGSPNSSRLSMLLLMKLRLTIRKLSAIGIETASMPTVR